MRFRLIAGIKKPVREAIRTGMRERELLYISFDVTLMQKLQGNFLKFKGHRDFI